MSGSIRLKGATSGYIDITAPDSGANTTLNLGTLVAEDGSGNVQTDGNLLVGTTNSNPTSAAVNDAGVELSNTGGVRSTVASNPAATFNRKTDDGAVVLIRKDGSTKANIGINGGDEPYFARNVGTTSGIKIANGALYPCQSDGTNHDNAQNLGISTARWANLYLSGGAYIGGTVAANYLDDYEEGTFTAYLGFSGGDSGGLNYTNQTFVYTKVGRMVSFSGFLTWNQNNFTSASGRMYLRGLPFTIINGGSYRGGAGIHYSNSPWTTITVYQQEFRSEDGSTDMTFNFADATDGSIDSEITTYTRIAASGNFMVSGTYMTN